MPSGPENTPSNAIIRYLKTILSNESTKGTKKSPEKKLDEFGIKISFWLGECKEYRKFFQRTVGQENQILSALGLIPGLWLKR